VSQRKIKAYYQLIKPRVMYGNLITTVAGFLFAANGLVNWPLFMATILGTSFVISSACVINNVLDQDIDAKMERTKSRPLITGEVSTAGATVFGVALGILGILLLSLWTNFFVVGVGVFGFITYVWLYGALGKRLSVHGTLVGSLSGAAPILAGYVAVVPKLDITASLLFLIIFFWQMPEFYSISIFRQKEYANAGVPVSSVIRGVKSTVRQIFIYTILTIICIIALSATPLGTLSYLVVMLVFCARWLIVAVQGLVDTQSIAWSRLMFKYSLVLLLVFSLMISINPYLN